MSVAHPPPPPPPTVPCSSFKSLPLEQQHDFQTFIEEVSLLCKKRWHYISDDENCILLSTNYQVKPVLQEGPKCGLVALCMASQMLTTDGASPLHVEDVFSQAQTLGYTSQGEMFSVVNMAKLAEKLIGCQTSIIRDVIQNKEVITNHVVSGLPVLIPYDADANHEPCLKNGHSAHWAVITGICYILEEETDVSSFQQDATLPYLYHFSANSGFKQGLPIKKVFLYARHGKSSHLTLWEIGKLFSSNCNLYEVGAKHKNSSFVIPEGGVVAGLANKVLLLYPKPSITM